MKKTGLIFVSLLLFGGLMSGCEEIKDATDITYTITYSKDFTIDENLTTYFRDLDLNESDDYRKYKGNIRDIEIEYVRYSITSNTGGGGLANLYAGPYGGNFASATIVAGPISFAAFEPRPLTDVAVLNKDYFENLLTTGQMRAWAVAEGTNVHLTLHVELKVKVVVNVFE
ncbi:MAG: hypothetical protein Q8K00_09985 [Syntrophales bacterium]|nr:hypothetical protein [Syntrophales bacterium]